MKVCVIGAGPSGLTTIKQLLDENHEVTCFDANDSLGGIWYRGGDDKQQMKAYDNMMLTISMKLMSFSDYMYKDGRKFTDHKGYLQYLEEYAELFDLRSHIRFNSMVKDVHHEEDGSWSVIVSEEGGRPKSYKFDAVAVCSGPFKKPNTDIKEISGFDGEVIHSRSYRNNDDFVGKKVLAIGLAESGADMLREVSNVAQRCVVSIRSHTFLIPRLIYGKYSTDTLTTRSHHYEMWNRASDIEFSMKSFSQDSWLMKNVFLGIANTYGLASIPLNFLSKRFGKKDIPEQSMKNNMGQDKDPSKIDFDTENTPEVVDFINEWNKKSHHNNGNWSQKIIFSKNVSFVPNILKKKLIVKDCGIDHVEGKTVYFKDSTAEEFDQILLCTGFKKDFSLLSNVEIKDNNVRNLYKHSFHPGYEGTLALIGFVRPISGGIPICAEMQARYFAQLCSGNVKLPSDVNKRIDKEKDWEERWMSLSPNHTESMPSQIMFLDAIAKEIGCHYPFYKMILNPRLMVKLWFYSFNQSCYRLTGPHSNHDEALEDIMTEEVPLHDYGFMLTMIALSFMPSSFHPKNLDFQYGVRG
ncbi:NAD(P)-binding protein [Alcanivorax sp. PA15-N-34]|uniref:NAD(P)-binding protein n=2 Tax=Alcanivorax sediminis TaxID=2663008 RepID=A0A6N7LRI5_9GAMM|nr:NAD(P)-binding protein [Alcanivorax sediminis]